MFIVIIARKNSNEALSFDEIDVVSLHDQFKKDYMGRACSTNGGEEECI
jgi:hypothetical protein